MKDVILFYKRLIKPGGAERLLLKEYAYFKKMGYTVRIATYEYGNNTSFFQSIDNNDLRIIKRNSTVLRIIHLALFLRKNSKSIFVCNSGYIDFYLASVISRVDYFLHLHQPSFMSFNEVDKYSLLMRKDFNQLIGSNYGAKAFVKIKESLTILDLFLINIRAFISIKGIRKAKNVFVLSDFAVREKKIMYGIEAINISGALDESIFLYYPKKINKYNNYKNKLLTIARLDKNKRIDELIFAFSIFLKKNSDSILIIGGTGTEYQNLSDLIIQLGVEKNVKLVGFIPDEKIYDYYSWADLFISIDWADFRITSYEAMAMGTKVLLSDETDVDSDLITTGYYYLTEPNRYIVASNIEHALANLDIMSKNELFKILNNYTWSKYFLKMEELVNA